MKKLFLVLLLLGLAAAIGYLLGTDSGRARRDVLLARARRASSFDAEPEGGLAGASISADEVTAATS